MNPPAPVNSDIKDYASSAQSNNNNKTSVLSVQSRKDSLVSPEWLKDHLGQVRILDATMFLPFEKRDAKKEYTHAKHIQRSSLIFCNQPNKQTTICITRFLNRFLERRIPGAVFFDIDEVSDTTSPLPHMVPSPDKFAEIVGNEMGITNEDRVVVYDAKGLFSAARVWWLFRVFDHKNVSILNGGLPLWIKKGYPIESGPVKPPQPSKFVAKFHPEYVRSLEQIKQNIITTKQEQVVDARAADRFYGRVDEPRPGLRRGHIPEARNVPFSSLLRPEDGTVKSEEEIAQVFKEAQIDIDRPIVTSCGSGVSAAVLNFGLHLLGKDDPSQVGLYDGSWSEFGIPSNYDTIINAYQQQQQQPAAAAEAEAEAAARE